MPARRPSPNPETIAPSARRTSLSMAGILYGLTTLFLAVGAVNGQNNLLFWAFGLALGGLLISGLFSGAGMMGLRLHREPPPTARAGEPLTLRYSITNANRVVPLYCVTLTERLGRAAKGQQAPKPAVAFLPHSAARDEAILDAPSRPMRRGRMRLVGVTASSSFPFGLMRKSMDFDLPGSVLVLPARLELRGDLVPRPARRGQGGAASPTGIGHAEEFFGVREYVPGDPTRLIAWRPSARSDELVVRQHGTPPPTVVWVVLDLAPGDEPLERERAIALAGSLVELLAARGCAVGLGVEHAGIARQPVAGVWHARRLLAALAVLDELPEPEQQARNHGPRGGDARSLTQADRRQASVPRATPRIQRDHAATVVHARAASALARPGNAPAWATHLWSPELSTYLAEGATIPDPLLPPPRAETLAQKRTRWVREFLLVDPVGEAAMGDSSWSSPLRADGAPASPRRGLSRAPRARRTSEGAA